MRKKINAFLALTLACATSLHIGVNALAQTQTAPIVSVPDATQFGKPEFVYEGMDNYHANDVAGVIDKVQTYFTNNKYNTTWDWLTATYHLGNLEAYKATGTQKYYDQTYDIAESYAWKVNGGEGTTYLDAVATSLVYCVLHDLAPMDYKLDGVKAILDYNHDYGMVDYSWVDEIYMAGLSHSYLSKVTGDNKYSDIDYDTYEYYRTRFFDEESWLWFRDWQFVPDTGSVWVNLDNAKKVLWSRGNTWVYVSLAQRMEYMDKTDPAYERYKNDFLMMSEGLKNVRRSDGIWNVNLGDPNHKAGKEMTGTAGFLYGMCLGIELGLLDVDTYIPVVQKAYDTIVSECIFENGFVGYCQPPAGSPSSYTTEAEVKNNTVSYGVGLTMMGLSRFMRLCKDYEIPTLQTPKEAFDETNAKFAVLDQDWYKGVMFASTNATEYTTKPNNGVENLINGSWKSEEEGESFRGNGLTNGSIEVSVEIPEAITLEKIVLVLNASYSYKYKIELYNGETWTTVADTTTAEPTKSYLNEWKFTPTVCEKIKLTAYPYYSHPTNNTLWIREMLVYEQK